MRKSLLLASAMVMAGIAGAASATTVGSFTYYFSGACTDCSVVAGSPIGALAELTLRGTYVPGQQITSATFLSFHYDGTNLIPGGFTITHPVAIAGQISLPLPSSQTFSVADAAYSFTSSMTGVWSVSNSVMVADFGTGGSFSADASAAPEPATWAMMISGFGLIGAAMRRRKFAVRFA